MDLLNYTVYMHQSLFWEIKPVETKPEPFNDILIDVFVDIGMVFLVVAVLYGGVRLLRFIWALHNQKVRKLEEVNQNYLQDLQDLVDDLEIDTGAGGARANIVVHHVHNN